MCRPLQISSRIRSVQRGSVPRPEPHLMQVVAPAGQHAAYRLLAARRRHLLHVLLVHVLALRFGRHLPAEKNHAFKNKIKVDRFRSAEPRIMIIYWKGWIACLLKSWMKNRTNRQWLYIRSQPLIIIRIVQYEDYNTIYLLYYEDFNEGLCPNT